MPIDPIFLLGAGGHAKVVFGALLTCGIPSEVIKVRDDRAQDWAFSMNLIEQPLMHASLADGKWHVAIGNAAIREQIYGQVSKLGGAALTIIHPAAVVSPLSSVGTGVFVAAGAIISVSAVIGAGVIVNHGAVIDHDCRIEDFSHIAPGATLAGGVHIGVRTLVGAGANVLPGVQIGNDVRIGAGAVVINDVPDGQTWVGAPARPIQRS